MGSKSGQGYSGHEVGRRRLYRISFDSVGLPESIGDFSDLPVQFYQELLTKKLVTFVTS